MNRKISSSILKAHLLSEGVEFNWDLFRGIKKDYYENQFVYNQTSQGIKREFKIPQVLCLENKVISSILRRERSPWTLTRTGDIIEICCKGKIVSFSNLPEKPPYFGKILSDGTRSENVIAVAGEQIPGFFIYPFCYYFDAGVPCKFCSLKGTRSTLGKNLVSEFTGKQIREATILFQNTPWKEIPIISITTGTFEDCDVGAAYTSKLVRQVYDSLNPKIPIHLLTMPPKDTGLINKYKEAGVTSIAFNLEVFTPNLFSSICPGKEIFYGYKKLLRSFGAARKVFGDYKVFCGFVWGLEPLESTIKGYKYFLDRGVSISSNVFHSDAKSLYMNRPHPSVTTILDLCEAQTRLYDEYPLARPIFPVSMRNTMDFEVFRGDFK